MNLHLNKAHKKELGVDLKGLTNSTIGEVNGLRAAQEDTDLLTAQLVDLIGTSTQVWSLTQFYSVDFSQSRIDVKRAFSTNAQSRFASVVVDGVLGPPHLARDT